MVELRTINPPKEPLAARIRLPGSKSLTIRALVVAGLASGKSHLYGALDADDTTAAVRALRAFGVEIHTEVEPWTVVGTGGHLTAPEAPIDAGESGLTARLAIVLASHADGSTTVTGQGRLLERPIAGVVEALRSQDVSVLTTNGGLPATVQGQGGLWGGPIRVDSTLTSQFATALMLVAPLMREPAVLRVEDLAASSGYLELSADVMELFGAEVIRTITGFEIPTSGYRASDFVIEPDASAAAYPLVAAAITGGSVVVEGLALGSAQPDIAVAAILADMGCRVVDTDEGIFLDAGEVELQPVDVDLSHAPDGALAVAVACMFASGPSRISGLHTLRHKESNRLDALEGEMTKLGARVSVSGETLAITPGETRGAVIDSHGDHRIAMALAIAGLRIPGVAISEPGVVSKTWPGFWEALEAMASNVAHVPGMIVTMDGPSGAGKSTVSRAVAEIAGLPHLDTGAFYRAATLAVIRAGVGLDDGPAVAEVVTSAVFDQSDGRMMLDGEDVSDDIRSVQVTSAVSQMSAHPEVRKLLVQHQQEWIAAHGGRGVVEGRDIGTVVFPEADVKVYLDATPEVRARRRAFETGDNPDRVLDDLARRDQVDSARDASPLTIPEGATVVDTSDMTFDEVVNVILGLIPTDV